MEFEKIKAIIAEVLNVDENEITMETTFTDDLEATSARLIVSPFSPDCGGTAFTPSNEMPAKLLSVSFCPLLSDMYVVSSFTLLTVHTMQHDTQTSAQTNT